MSRFVKWLVLPAVLIGAAVFAAPNDAQAQGWGVSFYGGNPYGGYYAPSYGYSGYGGYGGGYSSYSYRASYGSPYMYRSYYGGGYPAYRSYYGGGHHHHHHHHCD